jgi:hypothetical protein
MAPFATQCSCSKSSSSACNNSSSSACTATCCSTSESNATSNSFGDCKHLTSVVAAIIKDGILSSLQLPEDLALFLDTLRQYNIGDSLLVQTHFCHEEKDKKAALFDRMHKRLKNIEKTYAGKYTRIMQATQPLGARQHPSSLLCSPVRSMKPPYNHQNG